MRRFRRCCAALIISGFAAGLAPAFAQPGGMFGDPPRPPGNVPSRPPRQFEPPPAAAPGPPPVGAPGPIGPPSTIQTQPLPPPAGATNEPQPAALPPGQQPLPGLAPGQRQPRGTPQPANTAPQPGDEVVTAPPSQKIINPTAIFSGLDKITGRITTFDVAINETVQFGALQVTPRVCYTRPPNEAPNTDSFVEVDEVTLQGEVKRIFTGWMFAASPGLHGVEHPIYDVWLKDCKGGGSPAPVAEAQPAAPPPRTPTRQQRPQAPSQPPPGQLFQQPVR